MKNKARTFKSKFKFFLYGILSFLLIISLWYMCALIFPKIKLNKERKSPEKGITVYVKSNGFHTDIIVPVTSEVIDWKSEFPIQSFPNLNNNPAYLTFGWGDRGFYKETKNTASDLKLFTLFKTIFGMGTSVMHLSYNNYEPTCGESCKKVLLSNAEYQKLVTFLKSSFDCKERKYIIAEELQYGNNHNFYLAKGKYSLFKTCNVWTGEALAFTGVKIGIWTPLESGIIKELE